MKELLPFVALVTCFDENEAIDYAAVRKQVRRQVAAGNNILACGTNGDFTSLTFAEKVRICAEVVEEVAGKVKVFVNAGTPSSYETVMATMVIIAFLNVLSRYIFHFSLAATEEITINLFVWVTTIGIGIAFERSGHLGMVTFFNKFPRSLQKASVIIYSLLAVGLFLILDWYMPHLKSKIRNLQHFTFTFPSFCSLPF